MEREAMSDQEEPEQVCKCGHDAFYHTRPLGSPRIYNCEKCGCMTYVPAEPPAAPRDVSLLDIPVAVDPTLPPNTVRIRTASGDRVVELENCAAPDSPPADFGKAFPPDDIPDAQCFTLPNGDCVAPDCKLHAPTEQPMSARDSQWQSTQASIEHFAGLIEAASGRKDRAWALGIAHYLWPSIEYLAAHRTAALEQERDLIVKSWKAEERVWRESDQAHRIKAQQMQAGAEGLLERIAELEAALRKYGRHDVHCPAFDRRD